MSGFSGFAPLSEEGPEDDLDDEHDIPVAPAAASATGAAGFAAFGSFGEEPDGDDGSDYEEPFSSPKPPEPKPEPWLDEVTCFLKSNLARSKTGSYKKFSARAGTRHFELKTTWSVPVTAGCTIKAFGRWSDDRTFFANRFDILKPQDEHGIRQWFSGGAVPNVGSATGEQIIAVHGDRTHLILGDVEEIVRCGVPRRKALLIADAYLANGPEHRATMRLLRHLGYSQVNEVMELYGLSAIDLMETKPWVFSRIAGITFDKADEMAQDNGISMEHPDRVMAGMEYALKTFNEAGHSGAHMDEFVRRTMGILNIDPSIVRRALPDFVARPEIEVTDMIVSRKSDRDIERMVAYDIARIYRNGRIHAEADVVAAVRTAEEEAGIGLDPSQRQAAVDCIRFPVSVMTGGPGVGKSTTLKVIVRALEILGEKSVLFAPTGRASKKMQEVTKLPASTIHRLLRFDAKSVGRFYHNRRRTLSPGRCIADESSMIDINLARSLLQAIPDGSRLILVGDVDQLASVGWGQFLRDVIGSEQVPVSRLTKIHRQAEGSGIVDAAYKVNAGIHLEPVGNDRGFCFRETKDDDELVPKVVKLVAETLKDRGFDPRTDVQVLCAVRSSGISVDLLNKRIKEAVNPGVPGDGRTVSFKDRRLLSVGDRVIQTTNQHKIGIYNGDVGYVVSAEITAEGPTVTVEYTDQEVKYVSAQMMDIELCYATTIHKSQGSEYPAAVVLMPKSHAFNLNRNLVYTAITRAKDLCFLVGSRVAVRQAIDKQKEALRTTSLGADLRREFAAPSLLHEIEGTEPNEIEDDAPSIDPSVDRERRLANARRPTSTERDRHHDGQADGDLDPDDLMNEMPDLFDRPAVHMSPRP